MSANYNRVIIAGNLTRDPELRSLANETAVVNFSLAVNRRYKGGDGEMVEETTFVECEGWGRTAELVGQYLTKGSSALVEGRLKLDRWEDKDGNKRSQLRVVADSVQFLGGKGGDGGGGGGSYQEPKREHQSSGSPAAPMDDQPPF